MLKLIQSFVFFIIFSLSCAAMAAVDLNSGVVNAADRSQQALNASAKSALSQVLVKVSGNPSVTQLPQIQLALNQAPQYIQSYVYLSADQPGQPLQVRISFDGGAIDQLLTQAKQTVWRSDRPVTLAWINVDQNNNDPNTVVASGDASIVASALHDDTGRMGLPLILPAMDIQDQSYMNSNQDMPFDTTKLKQAATRYHVNSILAGNLSTAVDGSWQGQWLYILKGVTHQWQSVGKTPNDVIQQSIDNMDSILSSVLAARDNASLQSPVVVEVMGVTNLHDYALVLADLRQIDAVAHISVGALNGTTLQLNLSVVGGEKTLQQALAASSDLKPMPQPVLHNSIPVNLFYRFNSTNGAVS